MTETRDSFPNVAQAAMLLLANFLLQYLLGALLHDLRDLLGLDEPERMALVMLLSYALLLLPLMHYLRIGHDELFQPSGASWVASTVLLVPPVLLLLPLVLRLDSALIALLEALLPLSLWEEQAFAAMNAQHLGAIMATCLLAPLLEEMLFRGLLLRSFLRQYPRWPAIACSALLFGAAHLNVYQFALAFALGFLLGWLYERSGSLLPCIALHAGVNISAVVLANSEAPEGQLLSGESPLGWGFAVLTALVGGLMLRRLLGAGRRSAGGSS